jgi:hypothetical protein
MRYFIAIAFQLCFRIYQEGPVNAEGLELNGTHQLPVYADNVNTVGKNINMIKTAEALLETGRKVGLDVDIEKTKYMVVSSPECRTKS